MIMMMMVMTDGNHDHDGFGRNLVNRLALSGSPCQARVQNHVQNYVESQIYHKTQHKIGFVLTSNDVQNYLRDRMKMRIRDLRIHIISKGLRPDSATVPYTRSLTSMLHLGGGSPQTSIENHIEIQDDFGMILVRFSFNLGSVFGVLGSS